MNEPFGHNTVNDLICKYCSREYKRPTAFKNHTCLLMRRNDEVRTLDGKTAWFQYSKWMKANHRKPQTIETFMDSSYFTAFLKFAKYAKRLKISSIDRYVKIMTLRNIPPSLWSDHRSYDIYANYLKHRTTYLEHTKITIKTLMRISHSADCDVADVFGMLHPNEIRHLISIHKLSPWVLLLSNSFKVMYSSLTHEMKQEFEKVMPVNVWSEKLKQSKDKLPAIKRIIGELGI